MKNEEDTMVFVLLLFINRIKECYVRTTFEKVVKTNTSTEIFKNFFLGKIETFINYENYMLL